MLSNFRRLDEILRGDATRMSQLREGRIDIPASGLTQVVAILAMAYGLCMGSYGLMRTALAESGVSPDAWRQLAASTVKLPMLFFLTLVVTFPSLYVFNVLVGSRLSALSMMRLLVAMLGVILAVLASLGPIVVFFAVSTNNYPFMKILNVAMASIAGVLGLMFLLRTLHRLVMVEHGTAPGTPAVVPAASASTDGSSATDDSDSVSQQSAPGIASVTGTLDHIDSPTNERATTVFSIWVAVFALVGAQMSWVLRPFIGSPNAPFQWFRKRESNFFLDVLQSIGDIFTG